MLLRRRLLGLVAEAPGSMIATAALALTATATAVGQAVAVAEMLRRVVVDPAPAGVSWEVRILGPLTLAAGCAVARAVLLWLRDLAATQTAAGVKLRLRDRLVGRLLDLGPGGMVQRPAGTVQASVTDGVEALEAYVGFYLPQVVVSVFGPTVVVGILLWVDPVSGAIVGIAVLALPVARSVFRQLLGARGRAHWVAYEAFAARMLDALYGMITLTTLGASGRHGDRLRAEADRLYRATMGDLAASATVYVATALITTTGTVLAVTAAGLRYADGALDAAAVLLVLLLAAEAFRPQLELQNYWHEGFQGLAAAEGIFALLDAPAPVTETPRPVIAPWRGPSRAVEVRFVDVGFTYPGTHRPAVAGISLLLPAGRTLALVGRSGAGKSTLTALLQRFVDPDRGRIEIDGLDLRAVSLTDARALSAVVSQDTYLFHGTVAENLRLAAPDATDEALRDACHRARIHDEITALPGGYDTVIGERGTRLSGGQRQRVAIARALLSCAPVLILDEATSQVDGSTERALRAALAELTEGRTTLVIAHRLSTVAEADTVAVLDSGRLVEYGSPVELYAAGGGWTELVTAHNAAR